MSEYKDAPNDLAPRNKSSADDWARAYIAQLEYKLAKAEADNERLREALKDIGDADPVDMALDPQWPARIARAARAEQEK